MNVDGLVDEILEKYKNMGVKFNYAIGRTGIYVDYTHDDNKIWQYDFYKFEE